MGHDQFLLVLAILMDTSTDHYHDITVSEAHLR